MIKKRDWKQGRNSDLISKFITIPDEAMGMLALQNMAPDLIEYINTTSIEGDDNNEQTPGDKKTSKAKYTQARGEEVSGFVDGIGQELRDTMNYVLD